MNKRERRKQLEAALRREFMAGYPSPVEVWQDKPYTAVKVVAMYNGQLHAAYGFSKVQYPDKWDASYGFELAVDKAVAKIAKKIMSEGEEGND